MRGPATRRDGNEFVIWAEGHVLDDGARDASHKLVQVPGGIAALDTEKVEIVPVHGCCDKECSRLWWGISIVKNSSKQTRRRKIGHEAQQPEQRIV